MTASTGTMISADGATCAMESFTMQARHQAKARERQEESDRRKAWEAVHAEFPVGSLWSRRDSKTLMAYYLETVDAQTMKARAFAYCPTQMTEVLVIPLSHLKDIEFVQITRDEFFDKVCIMLEFARKEEMGPLYSRDRPLFATLPMELLG